MLCLPETFCANLFMTRQALNSTSSPSTPLPLSLSSSILLCCIMSSPSLPSASCLLPPFFCFFPPLCRPPDPLSLLPSLSSTSHAPSLLPSSYAASFLLPSSLPCPFPALKTPRKQSKISTVHASFSCPALASAGSQRCPSSRKILLRAAITQLHPSVCD